jgi:hypothetical protein
LLLDLPLRQKYNPSIPSVLRRADGGNTSGMDKGDSYFSFPYQKLNVFFHGGLRMSGAITESKYQEILSWFEKNKVMKVADGDFWKVKNNYYPHPKIRDILEKQCGVSGEHSYSLISRLAVDMSEAAIAARNQQRLEKKKEAVSLKRYEGMEDFVKEYFRENNVQVGSGGTLKGLTASRVKHKIVLAVSDYNRKITKEMTEIGYSRLDHFTVHDAIEVVCSDIDDAEKAVLQKKIKYDPEVDPAKSNLARFVRAVRCPKAPQSTLDLDIAVMEHMIWQVKKRFFGEFVDNVLCCFLYGAQNTGKTTSLRKLFKPIERYTYEQDITSASDGRWMKFAQSNYVLNVEELMGMSKSDVEALKSFVTRRISQQRQLGGHTMIETQQNLSIFGSTNRCISSIIFDDTGMRRWYQIESVQTKGQKLRFSCLDAIDYLALWQSVDESKNESPVYSNQKLSDQLLALQEKWRSKTETEEWLVSMGMLPREDARPVRKTLDQISMEMNAWAESNGYHKVSISKIRSQLKGLQIKLDGKDYILSEPLKKGAPTTDPDALPDTMDFDALGD